MDKDQDLKNRAASLLQELFLDYRKVMRKWATLTGQGAGLDSGYIAQHLVSLITGKRGIGFRGKGLDLEDNSEVKSACVVDGVDVPRWNHNLNEVIKIDKWLGSPNIYYVLFDYLPPERTLVRVRIWTVSPATDQAYRKVLKRWQDKRRQSNNFQLHPPVNKLNNVATNLCGNLDLPLIFNAEESTEGKMVGKFLQTSTPGKCALIERGE